MKPVVKVSVVIPVYNVEAYLRQCLDSVVNQTLREIEIICVDDGSTDASPSILAEYAAKDSRVKIITRPHTNAGAARNAGMSLATGEYLAFVDSDDFCELTLYEKAYAKAKVVDADLVTWRFDQYGDKAKKFLAARVFPKLMLDLKSPFGPEQMGDILFVPLGYGPWTRIVRRELVGKHGLRFQEIERTNDVYFCCLALALSGRQAILDEVLYHYRTDRPNNLQSGNAKTPLLVIGVWQSVRDGLVKYGLWERLGKHLALPSANSLFYTLHTIDSVSVFEEFYRELKRLYTEGGAFASVDMQDLARNGQTQFFLSTLRSSTSVNEYLVRQLNYHRRRLADTWWSEQSLKQDLAQVNAELANAKSELVRCTKAEDSLRNQLAAREATCTEQANQITELKQQSAELGTHLLNLHAKLEHAKSESESKIANLSGTIVGLKGTIANFECELNSVKQSKAYRLGCMLIWPFRKVMHP